MQPGEAVLFVVHSFFHDKHVLRSFSSHAQCLISAFYRRVGVPFIAPLIVYCVVIIIQGYGFRVLLGSAAQVFAAFVST